MFEFWPAAGLPPKPTGQLGIQYVTGAAWAWAVRPPRQSAANTNARANLLEKMDIRATAKCPETIPSRYQERQCGAPGRRITKEPVAVGVWRQRNRWLTSSRAVAAGSSCAGSLD